MRQAQASVSQEHAPRGPQFTRKGHIVDSLQIHQLEVLGSDPGDPVGSRTRNQSRSRSRSRNRNRALVVGVVVVVVLVVVLILVVVARRNGACQGE